MVKKRLVSAALAVIIVVTSLMFAVPTAFADEDLKFSQEYMSSPFYEKLTASLENSDEKTAMQKTFPGAPRSEWGDSNYKTADLRRRRRSARADRL